MQFWAIITDSIRDSMDRKIFWVLFAMTVVVTLAMLSIGFEADRVSFFFGLWEPQTQSFDPESSAGRDRIVGIVVYFILNLIIGWIGVILMIIATAGQVPAMMERGSIDLLLSKPISRPRLFLYKYLAGLVFVVLQAGAFVLLTFLVMWLRWDVPAPGYLLSIPLMVLLFSYMYCVSVLTAVRTRSTVAAILLSLVAWFVFSTPAKLQTVFNSSLGRGEPLLKERYPQFYQAIRVAGWILPKPADTPYLAARWAGAGTSIDALPNELTAVTDPTERAELEEAKRLEQGLLTGNAALSIGTSLMFEAAIVLGAMFMFCHRDY